MRLAEAHGAADTETNPPDPDDLRESRRSTLEQRKRSLPTKYSTDHDR